MLYEMKHVHISYSLSFFYSYVYYYSKKEFYHVFLCPRSRPFFCFVFSFCLTFSLRLLSISYILFCWYMSGCAFFCNGTFKFEMIVFSPLSIDIVRQTNKKNETKKRITESFPSQHGNR